jgi:cysteinyl-tRNA synthetase
MTDDALVEGVEKSLPLSTGAKAMKYCRPNSSGLCLVNTMTGKKEDFVPRQTGAVKMFTCGPSIYKRPHIGNYRTFLYEDILQRYLEYRGAHVNRLINFTDVEDKALAEMGKKDISLEALTNPVEEQFFKDAGLLRIKLPALIPRSSTTVAEAVNLIRTLLKNGYAYRHSGDIFYDPLKFNGFGKLFGLDMSRWPKQKKRFRKDTYPGNRWNLGDFILWHGHENKKDCGLFWKTPIGQGRPAWNVQDAAMIASHLGLQIDIACGGVDNLYRHHDYTLAIIEAVTGRQFTRHWLHGEHVVVDGSKMSKSKGNTVYPDMLIEDGYHARHIRLFLIAKHYRKRLNLTRQGLQEMSARLDSFRQMVRSVIHIEADIRQSDDSVHGLVEGIEEDFIRCLNDDLDIPAALDGLYKTISTLRTMKTLGKLSAQHCEKTRKALEHIDSVLQVVF